MLLSNLALTNLSRKSLSVPDPRDVFPECKNFIQPRNMFEPKIQTIKKDELLCILGSIMIAGNGDYQVTGAIPYEIGDTDEFQYNKTKTVKNALAVIGNEVHVYVYPVSKVECLESDSCTIQFMRVSHSIIEYGVNQKNGNLNYAYGKRFIVSTKYKGSIKLSQYSEINKKKKIQDVYDESDFYLISPQQKAMKFKRGKYGDFEDGSIKNHDATSGDLQHSNSFQLFSNFNEKEAKDLLEKYGRGDDVSLVGHVYFEWKPVSNSNDITEWYFPEITATLSSDEGIFTIDDIDQKFPISHSSGMSAVGALFIVIGVIGIIVVPIFATYLIKNKKKQHYETV